MRYADPQTAAPQALRDLALVAWIRVRMEEADGDNIDVALTKCLREFIQLRAIKWHEHFARRIQTFRNTEDQARIYERSSGSDKDVVEFGSSLAPDLKDILKTFGGNERNSSGFALE